MKEYHPWMKFFTWVTIMAGVIAIYGGFSMSSLVKGLFWLIAGATAVIAGFWALVGTNDYKQLSQSSELTKLMARLSSTIGALLSSFLIILIFMAYAANKQNRRGGLS
ncbi:MAG: hypothetical protein QW299_09325 [Candidatus Caldarchaeum sp.]